MPRFSLISLFAILALMLPVGLGVNGCPSSGGNDPQPAEIDPDAVVLAIAGASSAGGAALLVAPETFPQAIVGLVIKGWGDATTSSVVPMKQAIESGECKGQTASFTIDPSPYVGLPGTPETPEQVDAAKDEAQQILALAVPGVAAGVGMFAQLAKQQGDQTGCVVLTAISNFVAPAGDLTVQVLAIIENPGEPFTFPGLEWDCSACLPDEPVATGPQPLSPSAPTTVAPATLPSVVVTE